MKSVLSKYRQISSGTKLNAAQNIIIDGEDTFIPLNLPTCLASSKGGGKSTAIVTLINAEKKNDVYARIIYICTDHVDSTLAETCHETLIRVPVAQAVDFIVQYFKIKAEYMSWIKFLNHNYSAGLITETFKVTKDNIGINDLLRVYTDNIVDVYVRNTLNINKTKKGLTANIYDQFNPIQRIDNSPESHIMNPTARLLDYATTFIDKYSKKFEIVVQDTTYHIDPLQYDQYDQLIIDDVGVAAPYLFPTTPGKSVLYRYLTISRHILLGTIIACQDIMQLPRYVRKEINTYLFGIGLDIETVTQTNIPKNKQREIINDYSSLKQYDFILYNGIDGNITYLSLN